MFVYTHFTHPVLVRTSYVRGLVRRSTREFFKLMNDEDVDPVIDLLKTCLYEQYQ